MHPLRGVFAWASLMCLLILATVAAFGLPLSHPGPQDAKQIERGRYLVRIAGCNDCHTGGYRENAGHMPEKEWLTGGNHLGFRGPWGTTYAPNLRVYMNAVTEDQWVVIAHTAEFRPPMPWFALHAMKEEDLRAIHRFVKHLGPAGGPVPTYVPPGQEPAGPYVLFPEAPTR